MSVLFGRRDATLTGLGVPFEGLRGSKAGTSKVSQQRALRHSVIWGATRLRADLVSLMPVDVFRKVGVQAVELMKPQVLINPFEIAEGQPMNMGEWMYSTQTALDRMGNNVGIVHARDGLGIPASIEPLDPDHVSFKMRGSRIIEYKVDGDVIDPKHIWHERQYTIAGVPVGLSPIAHAALQLSAGLSAQEFALAWFQGGAVPSAILRNSEKSLTRDQAQEAKASFKASIQNGDVWTTGKDWTYEPVAAKAAEASFIEQMQYTDADLCRFMGVPADMLDVAGSNASQVTYANVTQRNLQLLVMNLGGTIKRREDALSRLTPSGRYVKLNRSAVLAMDDKTRAEVFQIRIDSRTITPDMVRAHEDEGPLTEADYTQFDRLFAKQGKQGTNG